MSFPSPLNPDPDQSPKGFPVFNLNGNAEEIKHETSNEEVPEEKPSYRREEETIDWVEIDPEVNNFTISLINSFFLDNEFK